MNQAIDNKDRPQTNKNKVHKLTMNAELRLAKIKKLPNMIETYQKDFLQGPLFRKSGGTARLSSGLQILCCPLSAVGLFSCGFCIV
jgi:hypothetical protein